MSTIVATAGAASRRGPFRLAVVILVLTTLTVLKGAMTTSTGSGMAFRDWPFSDGQWMPERSYTTVPGFLEHFHRLFGAATGLVALALAIWLTAARTGDRRVRVCAWLGGCLVLVQGVVGGTGVLNNLPAINSVTHGTLAQLTLAMFAWIAYQLSDRYRATAPLRDVAPGAGRKLMTFTFTLVVVQTVLGAIARHTNSQHALWTHVGNALVVFVTGAIATAFAVGRLRAAPGVAGLARSIVALLMVQIALGFVVLAVRNPEGKHPDNVARIGAALVVSVHVLLGALLTMLLALLTAHVFRATRLPAAEREFE